VVVINLWGRVDRWTASPTAPDARSAVTTAGSVNLDAAMADAAGYRAMGQALALRGARDEAAALRRAVEMNEALLEAGMAPAAAADAVLEVALESPGEWVRAGAERALGLEVADARPDTVLVLENRIRHLEAHSRALQRARDAAEAEASRRKPFSLLVWIRSILDDVGIGIGWGALYFTAFTTLWKGYTPGKRLLGIRVIQLDGRPVGWWSSIERFGGYAASLATGLLGFAQITWDPNRQGMHDKISQTVVVQQRGRKRSPREPRNGGR
jgi:hypothetical protein